MSSNKIAKVKEFNEILESLLVQMSPIIGTTYHKKFVMIIKLNAMMPIKSFITRSVPFREKIINRDETYFETDTAVNTLDVNAKYINNILQLQNIYTKLDKTSRDNVWQIFQCMLVLAEEWKEM
jgi:hypothetical protein